MSNIYLKNTYGIEKPAIGLLNIGTEETKGNDLVKESYKLLKENSEKLGINFVGNVEGRDAFSGKIDAIVTDGFTGNVFLKTTEGVGKLVKRTLKESLKRNLLSKILAIPALPAIKRLSKAMDYKSYGGALFLGVKKPVVKAHGSSDTLLFEYTIIQAEKFVENKAVEMMMEEFEKQTAEYKESVLPKSVRARVAVEAASSISWGRYVGLDGAYICLDRFGESAPANLLFKKFGFTVENVVLTAIAVMAK